MGKRNIKCSTCEHGKWSGYFRAWTCTHPDCKEVPIFKGSTHPHCCPLVGGKKYIVHRNLSRGTDGLMRNIMTDYRHG